MREVDFELRLSGGHPNALGQTVDVVDDILTDTSLFDNLFKCYFSKDPLVRLRTSNAMKRICKVRKDLLAP